MQAFNSLPTTVDNSPQSRVQIIEEQINDYWKSALIDTETKSPAVAQIDSFQSMLEPIQQLLDEKNVINQQLNTLAEREYQDHFIENWKSAHGETYTQEQKSNPSSIVLKNDQFYQISYKDFINNLYNVPLPKPNPDLYDATRLLCNLVYKHIRLPMKENDVDAALLWVFVRQFQTDPQYPLSNLLEISFVKTWWDQQSAHIQTVNMPYWRKALFKRSNILFQKLETQRQQSQLNIQ